MDPSYCISIVGQTLAVTIVLVISHYLQRRLIKQEARSGRIFLDTSLRRLNGTVTAIIHSWPGPAWIKVAIAEEGQTVFRMLELNGAAEKEFGIPRLDYIGNTDREAGCTEEQAEQYRRLDLLVWASGESDILEGEDGQAFTRVCIVSSDGEVKGVMGLSVGFIQAHLPGKKV
jgi:hypothetical protein